MSSRLFLPRKMVPLERFQPHVMAMTPGTNENPGPSPVVTQSYLRGAAIQFAADTGILRRKVVLDLQEGLKDYPLFPDCEETLVRVRRVCVNGVGYLPVDTECGTCPWGNGYQTFSFDNDTVSLSQEPCEDQTGAAEIDIDVMPSQEACSVDEVLFNRWRMAIVDGALVQLHLIPNKPWSSANASELRERKFREAMGKARIARQLSNAGANKKMMQNPFVLPSRY